MKALQVRDLPENIYYLLQKNARNNCRSLSGEAIITLAKGLETRISNKDRREKLLSMIKKTPCVKKEVLNINPVDFIREDRER